MKLLQAANTNLRGVIMTMIPTSKDGYYGYQYYSYDEDAHSMKRIKLLFKRSE